MQPCPSPFHYNCPCGPVNSILHTHTATYYPASKLIRVNKDLYKLCSYLPEGCHTTAAILTAIDEMNISVRLVITTNFACRWLICAKTINPNGSKETISLMCNDTHRGARIMHHIFRIQRALKTWLVQRRLRLFQAFALGTQTRLGKDSCVLALNDDFLAMICAQLHI